LVGFEAEGGDLLEEEPLLSVSLDRAGRHDIRFRYRPARFLLGLGMSGIAFVLWAGAVISSARRRSRGRRDGSGDRFVPPPAL
jgi:hypothetical protein